ncbi:MAG: hypothetical protein ACXWWU_06475 [Candidatus Limnocylindria bacterium]
MIRKMLLHVPILGGWVERRWMPDPVERDLHREVVRDRLEAPARADVPDDRDATEEMARR